MTFSFQPVFWGTVLTTWLLACLKTHCGPLALLALAVTHTRAFCLCLRRELARVPGRWRNEYQFALREIKESK